MCGLDVFLKVVDFPVWPVFVNTEPVEVHGIFQEIVVGDAFPDPWRGVFSLCPDFFSYMIKHYGIECHWVS